MPWAAGELLALGVRSSDSTNMSGALFTNFHSPNLFSYSSTQMQALPQENDEPELCLTFLQKPRQNDVFGGIFITLL